MTMLQVRRWVVLMLMMVFVPTLCAAQSAPAGTGAAKPNPKLAELAAGTAIDLGPLNLESPEGEGEGSADHVTDYSGMTYDPHNHRLLMFGGGHATTFTDTIYAFSFETLQWKALYKPTPQKFYKPENMDKGFWKSGGEGPYPRPMARHTYDLLIVPDHRKEFLLLRDGCGPSSVAPGIGYFGSSGGAYDFATGKWEAFPSVFGGYGGVSEYDPVSKKILAMLGQKIYLFDTDTRKTEVIMNDVQDRFKVTGYSGTLVYCPIDQRMYAIPASMEVWTLEMNRTDFTKSKIAKVTASGTAPPNSECAFVFDPVRKVISGGVNGNKFFSFNPATSAWTSEEIKGAQPETMTFHCLSYDPVDHVYIFIAGGHTYAYRAGK